MYAISFYDTLAISCREKIPLNIKGEHPGKEYFGRNLWKIQSKRWRDIYTVRDSWIQDMFGQMFAVAVNLTTDTT